MRSAPRSAATAALAAALVAGGGVVAACGTTAELPMSAPFGHHGHPIVCTPPALPGTTVHVVLGDMGPMMADAAGRPRMMLRALPGTVPAGTISFEVANMGWRRHEMVVLPLPDGQPGGRRASDATGRIDESASLGEASATCAAGEGDGIRAGTAGWITLSLPPGRYELVCNRPHHYDAGMYEAFTVS